MTTYAEAWKSAAEPFGRMIFAATGLVMARLRRLAVAFQHRHDATVLLRFDDRMLADIGLTRRDVREAFSEPVWRDPTDLLAEPVAWRRPNRLRARPSGTLSVVPEVGRVRTLGVPRPLV